MLTLVPIALFGLLMIAISYVGYRHYARPARLYDQLGAGLVGHPARAADGRAREEGVVVRVFREIGAKVPVSPQDVSTTRRYLIAAGHRSESAIGVFYGIKAIACAVLFILAMVFRNDVTSSPILRIVIIFAAVLAGYFGPNLILEWLVGARQEAIRYSLPDALDLMVVCVEAGLGLDQAILSVSRELEITHKEISDELHLVTLEMQAGKRRAEALRNLADRTGETELRKLVAILVQTDRFGTSMAESLRTHSDFMRVRRRQEAEERAGKVGVKLVFPIFFCILPSMLVVTAGPGLLQIFKQLFPMMQQFSQNQ
jgi:tight adherence protein C